MSDSADTVAAHEAYAFACMRCGRGWEQSFDIEHHVDDKGRTFVVYKCDGRTVPSPLTSPSCPTCDGHVVRIMRSGQVAAVRELSRTYGAPQGRNPVHDRAQAARAEKAAGAGLFSQVTDAAGGAPDPVAEPWHPHLPEFLRHLFRHEQGHEERREHHHRV